MFIHFAISMRAFPIAMTSVTKWSWWFFIRSQLREATGDRCNSSIRAAASNILDFRFACGPQAEQRLDEQMLWLLDDKICFSFSLDLLKRGKPKYIPQYISYMPKWLLAFFPVQYNQTKDAWKAYAMKAMDRSSLIACYYQAICVPLRIYLKKSWGLWLLLFRRSSFALAITKPGPVEKRKVQVLRRIPFRNWSASIKFAKLWGSIQLLCGLSQDQKNLWENHEPEHMMC